MPIAIVSGAIGNKPANGGNAWSRISWISGLQRLGFSVVFIEEISSAACVDAQGAPSRFRDSANLAYFKSVMDQFGLANGSSLICDGGQDVYGVPMSELKTRAKDAAFLFNFSGHLALPELKSLCRHKLYYDDDPGFTQIWHASGSGGARLDGHDSYFTLGANIGAPDCLIPTGNIPWRHTRPPVVLEQWPAVARTSDPFRFTTIASWRGAFGPVQWAGKTFGVKVHEFRKVFDLPNRVASRFEIALQIHPADRKDLDALRSHGWQIVDPKHVADTPDAFRRYVQDSGAEFSVAQGIYVDTNSGWFSDRTVRYLASGRPALVQETGFSRHIPTGKGLVSFRALDDAVEGAERIVREYPEHCRAARAIAEHYFDSDKVIGALLRDIGL